MVMEKSWKIINSTNLSKEARSFMISYEMLLFCYIASYSFSFSLITLKSALYSCYLTENVLLFLLKILSGILSYYALLSLLDCRYVAEKDFEVYWS